MVGHKGTLPSPPPSPPRGVANVAPASPNTPLSKMPIAATGIPSPDVSHDDLNPDAVAAGRYDTSRAERAHSPRLNDFELIRVLGKGCAGRVLLVKHTPTSRVHAMKAISKRAVLANDELDHTLAEQRILSGCAQLERRSAFISRLYYSFCDKENFYLVMEFYPGGDLATQMEIHGVLGPLRTRFYTCDIVAGLETLHREGILVRDLKPENILLNWHGHAVLADFGLSKSFGHRGDPVPVKLPPDYIEGKGTPPMHAGKGFGSYRQGELTWDRAYSFVGTQEYLAPEVIKRNHYTYAIDWWALGCIVCECLTGRVPFRGHGDESNAELYERVINSRWDAMYRGDHPRSYLKERYRIDTTTYDFIEGLLQKEPMFRLTEPSVKQHPYFTNVDWETVEKGDYQDPFQLDIDPVAEYNTQFFPRLCLEETPTVDMTGHDYGKEPDGEQNALNNDSIYHAAQAEFAKELESFEWTCASTYEFDDEVDGPLESYHDAAAEPEAMEQDEPVETIETPASPLPARAVSVISAAPSAVASVVSASPISPVTTVSTPTCAVTADDMATIPSDPADSVMESLKDPQPEADSAGVVDGTTHMPAESIRSPKAPSVRTTASRSSRAPSVVLPEVTPEILAAATAAMASIPDSPQPKTSPALLPMSPSTKAVPGVVVRLPSGPPSSGLSVSDVIAVNGSVQGSPNLIIRRHRQLPSIDKYPHARLSVEFNGTFGALGDEDWEQLDAETIPEMVNGANASGQASVPGSFFARLRPRTTSRMLGRGARTPSVRVPSGLRKAVAVASDSDTSSDRSPTKARQPLFTARGIENTKRAFTRIKAFPPASKHRAVSGASTEASSTSPSPVASIRGSTSQASGLRAPVDDSTVKRGTLSAAFAPSTKRGSARSGPELPGLFTRPKARRARTDESSGGATSASTSVSASPSLATLDEPSLTGPTVPRVELTTTPPIVWDLSLESK